MNCRFVEFVRSTSERGALDHADMSIVRSLHCPLTEQPGQCCLSTACALGPRGASDQQTPTAARLGEDSLQKELSFCQQLFKTTRERKKMVVLNEKLNLFLWLS